MNILALEPFLGGSHQAFLARWEEHSQHRFRTLGLTARHWKWRMRQAAVSFADTLARDADRFDVLWASDMLNLAEFVGLAPEGIRRLPRIAYFHENQFTYPVRSPQERDHHFAFTNLTTALAAHQVWFNSAFHRDDFVSAADAFLARMPDRLPRNTVASIAAKAQVLTPGITPCPLPLQEHAGPLRIGWNARWEFDKNPEDFFRALTLLRERGLDFRLIVLGESYREVPGVFAEAAVEFADRIDHWGYAEDRGTYWQRLAEMDVLVSTAKHEFFGIGVLEAMSAGAVPVLPNRLAYPQILQSLGLGTRYLYEGTVAGLAATLARRITQREAVRQARGEVAAACAHFAWPRVAARLDAAAERVFAAGK